MHLSGVTETSHAIPGLEAVLTTSELAAHLGVKVQTMRDLLHARRGPCGFRVGREMRYQVSEVQYWVETLEFQDQAAPLADLAGSTACKNRPYPHFQTSVQRQSAQDPASASHCWR
ncbi:helix-turn-helix domain-containing protein [Cryobacterium sp. Y29]|uniref:helix-turn-helix domain-containing protein n=1 Tax=Cryobacterium sp. Y29 TaxID=2048285 RepID=UPI0018EA3BD6